MSVDLLQQGLIVLQVASLSTCIEAQDGLEDILVIAQLGHSLDIHNMGMLEKT
jgi:hypothetical protein